VEIKSQIEEKVKGNELLKDLDLSSSTVEGNLVGVIAEVVSDFYDELQAVYNSRFVGSAGGVSLANLFNNTGYFRKQATKAIGDVLVELELGDTLPAQTVFQKSDGTVFLSTASLTATLGEQSLLEDGKYFFTVTLEARDSGYITMPSGSITTSASTLAKSIRHTSNGIEGENEETDIQFRDRVLYSPLSYSANLIGVMARIRSISNVKDVVYIQSSVTSIEFVVQGGDQQDIINVLGQSIPLGLSMIGSITGTYEQDGVSLQIAFNRPTEKNVEIQVEINESDGGDYEDFIKDCLAKDFALTIGKSFHTNRVYGCVYQSSGITRATVTARIKTDGNTNPYSTSDISAGNKDLLVVSKENIVVI
jgi:hypothetical protein